MQMQNLRTFQFDNYIMATVGALLVAASSLKFVAPVILIVFTLVLGWRKVKRDAVVMSCPIIVFASYQYLQLALRPESSEYYGDLSQVYLVMICVAIPYANMLITRPFSVKTLEMSVFFGVWATMFFWGFYQINHHNTCRIEPFGINALFMPITLLPLTYFFIALRFQEGRSNIVDSVTIFATLFCVASFTGSRMPLYTLVFSVICILGNLIYKKKRKSAALILLPLGAGLILALIKDVISGCNMFERIAGQLNMVSFNQIAVLMAILLMSLALIFLSKKITQVRNSMYFLLAFFSIVMLGIIYPYLNVGSISVAQHNISDALEVSTDKSTGLRWAFYSNSLNFLISGDWNWIIGNGYLAESGIVNQGLPTSYSFMHAHNQYLSWLIAGGVLGLCSGFLVMGRLWLHIFNDLPSFIFLILLGIPFLTNSPMYNAPITAQVIFLMLTMQIISCVRDGKTKIL